MHNVLLVYKQLSFQFDENGQVRPFPQEEPVVHVLSYDENPGIQAIANTTADLPPDNTHKTISRDYEYKRLGTVSLLAGIDLQTGEGLPLVTERHSSKEYIQSKNVHGCTFLGEDVCEIEQKQVSELSLCDKYKETMHLSAKLQ